jgi:hypothetical protein
MMIDARDRRLPGVSWAVHEPRPRPSSGLGAQSLDGSGRVRGRCGHHARQAVKDGDAMEKRLPGSFESGTKH